RGDPGERRAERRREASHLLPERRALLRTVQPRASVRGPLQKGEREMKVSLFNGMPYGPVKSLWEHWPPPNELFEPEQALKAADHCLEQAQLADEVGFDWISCAEHHFSPGSLSPNATVLAAALSLRVRRARLAILGALIPLTNPVRVAEEYAMIDTLTGGRLIAGLMRGAPYEYLVY